jgi:hypothetical protein
VLYIKTKDRENSMHHLVNQNTIDAVLIASDEPIQASELVVPHLSLDTWKTRQSVVCLHCNSSCMGRLILNEEGAEASPFDAEHMRNPRDAYYLPKSSSEHGRMQLIHKSAISPCQVDRLCKRFCFKRSKVLTLWQDLQTSPTTNDRIVGILSLFDNLLIFLSFSLL